MSNVYNYPTMYWRRLADGTLQKITPLRVYPWPRTPKKPVTVAKCPKEELVKQKLIMESFKKRNQFMMESFKKGGDKRF